MYVIEVNLVCFSLNMNGKEVRTVKFIKYEINTQVHKFEFSNSLNFRMSVSKWECIIDDIEYD